MAFLDNSGDIILDAVLTETGRKRLAAGNFNISKFALGDDEIRYDLYDKNHPSGSAYYDLEILQTPILEAFTQINANINYGLLSFASQRLLYLPSLVVNKKLGDFGAAVPRGADNLFYLAIPGSSGDTAASLVAAFGDGGDRYVLRNNNRTDRAIILEYGLETAGDIAGTKENVNAFISSTSLYESNMSISVDRRFIGAVLGPAPGTYLNNAGGDGAVQLAKTLNAFSATGRDYIRNHRIATVKCPRNNIVFRAEDTTVDTTYSEINGPRANFVALNFSVRSLSTDDFARHGFTGQNLFSDGKTYNYIDTEIYVSTHSVGATIVVPIRIIQQV